MKPRFLSIYAIVCLLHAPAFGQSTTNTLTPTADAQVNAASTGTNYGTALTANVDVSSSTLHRRYYLKFDIAGLSIPANAVIQSAELKLTPTGVGEGGAGSSSFILQTVAGSWVESGTGQITYASQPLVSVANQQGTSSLTGGQRVFDVKTLVQSYVNGTATYQGWMIRRNPENVAVSACQYHTRENGTASNRPQLVITWYVPMTITAAAITHATTSGSSNGSIVPTLTGGSGSFTYQWYNSGGTIGGATSSSISSRPYGWYGLRVTGQYGDVFYIAFLIGAQTEPVVITFNPGPNFIDDAQINNHTAGLNTNYANSVQIPAATWTNSTWYEMRNLLRFRLWFDPALVPLAADLYLFGADHSNLSRPNNAELQLITQAWEETKVTYATQPTFSNSILADMPTTSTSTENRVVDVKSFWNAWKASNTTNYGVMFKLDTYAALYTKQVYHSSDAVSSANWPYMRFQVDMAAADRQPYTSFARVIDAGYVTTVAGKLKVQFTEEYKQVLGKRYTLKLYDEDMVIKGAINYDGSAVGAYPLLPSVAYEFDDNRATLNLSSYSLASNGIYLLELTTGTGEKSYIKFMYIN